MIKITQDHIKLLSSMEFDLLYVGVNGKRPFGNSDMYKDIADILNWELPNDDLSYNQLEEADKLMKELPAVLNTLIKYIASKY